MSHYNESECVGGHTVRIDELGRISYATITAVPEPGVLIVRASSHCVQALKRVGDETSMRYDTCSRDWALGEWLLDSWWPAKQHLHYVEQ